MARVAFASVGQRKCLWDFKMTNDLSRREELIGQHLLYEIHMLHETRKALNGEPVSADVIANALMESSSWQLRRRPSAVPPMVL
jgi:hypothetical protein